jgi:hypothetical protein
MAVISPSQGAFIHADDAFEAARMVEGRHKP